jgi:anti-anti-sigma regulatory factor
MKTGADDDRRKTPIFAFSGWESTGPLAEESKNPKRNVPIGLVGSVIILMIYFVFVTWGYLVGFGVDNVSHADRSMLNVYVARSTNWAGLVWLIVRAAFRTLDSARTQVVMESLLQRIVDTGSSIAILDITGVPTVDTLVAQHLLKTVAAARLMGADCIISGIRPQIAQTIVHLGVDLNAVTTKATLADAFAVALKRNGLGVMKVAQSGAPASAAGRDAAAGA